MKKLRSFLLNSYTCKLYLIHNAHEQTLQPYMDKSTSYSNYIQYDVYNYTVTSYTMEHACICSNI